MMADRRNWKNRKCLTSRLDMDSLEDWVALVKTENKENFMNTFQTLNTL